MRTSFTVSLFVVLFLAVGGIWGGVISVTQFSVTTCSGTPPQTCEQAAWTPSGVAGSLLPAAGTWSGAIPDGGPQVGSTNAGSLTQDLGTALLANETYTFTVWVSSRVGLAFDPDIVLEAGSTPLITWTAAGTQGPAPNDDHTNNLYNWVEWTGTYTSPASGAPVGQDLEIVLGSTAAQTDFDEVSLTDSSAVPEPAMFMLVGAGLLGLVTRRRFAK